MRVLTSVFVYLLLVNLTGVPNVLVYALDDADSYVAMMDEEHREQENSEKGKEDKDEKEELKESFLACVLIVHGFDHGQNLEARNAILSESVFFPEDHSPPPDRA